MKKLESHIKETLEKRKITPSPEAWDTIATQISGTQKPRRKKFYAYAIAASFIGIFFASGLFLMLEEKATPVQIVEEEKPEIKEVQHLEQIEFQNRMTENTSIVEAAPIAEPRGTKTPQLDELHVPMKVAEESSAQSLKDSFLATSDDVIAQKVNEIVAQVELLETQNSAVSDAEVDSLLRAAQRQILTERVFAEDGSVDAMALLTEVEDELDTSFRDQIFDALKDGYFELRTAVANRNN